MSLFQTDFATGKKTMPNAQGDEVLSVQINFPVSTAMLASDGTTKVTLATNDVIELCKLPAGHVLADVKWVADAVDTGSTLSATVGILNAAKTAMATDSNGDGGNVPGAFITAAIVGRTAAPGTAVPSVAATAPYRIKPTAVQVLVGGVGYNTEADRSIGALIVAGLTGVAAGTLSLILSYRAGHYGA